jgi:hypothetical protein
MGARARHGCVSAGHKGECFRCRKSVWLSGHDVSSGHARAHIFLPGKCYLHGREPASACTVPALHGNDGRGGVRDDWYLVGVFRLPFSVLICFETASPQSPDSHGETGGSFRFSFFTLLFLHASSSRFNLHFSSFIFSLLASFSYLHPFLASFLLSSFFLSFLHRRVNPDCSLPQIAKWASAGRQN